MYVKRFLKHELLNKFKYTFSFCVICINIFFGFPGVCPKNEEYSECVPCDHCPIRNTFPICAKHCKRGCTCKKGFRRNMSGVCIPVLTCPHIRIG